ncbi:hypothetical protein HP439_04550 [Sphingobacterium shayense]|uniref:integrase core domain-containing protein n=1 Tax=Sphingobacterium shayense TaxID=626343 RepID=UPI001557E49C|nr:hypothetical protein [Sphingobacterium shayense]NQD69991.1 hypothetical protein [Sphingobacterium shayense]
MMPFLRTHKDASKNIDKIIRIYNSQRPHASLDFRMPEGAHSYNGEIKKRWMRYPRKLTSTEKVI